MPYTQDRYAVTKMSVTAVSCQVRKETKISYDVE